MSFPRPLCQDNSYGETILARRHTPGQGSTVTRWERPVGRGCRERSAQETGGGANGILPATDSPTEKIGTYSGVQTEG